VKKKVELDYVKEQRKIKRKKKFSPDGLLKGKPRWMGKKKERNLRGARKKNRRHFLAGP